MKKFLMSIMSLLLVCTVACTAQNKDQKNDEGRPNPMSKMIEELGLSDEQAAQFEALMKEMHPEHGPHMMGQPGERPEGQPGCRPEGRPEGRPCPPPDSLRGEGPEGRPCPKMRGHNPECTCECECCKALRQMPADSLRGERPTPEMIEQKKAEIEQKRAEIESKLKEILTEEQYAKLQQILQERREKGPEHGDRRPGEGGRPHHPGEGGPRPLNE